MIDRRLLLGSALSVVALPGAARAQSGEDRFAGSSWREISDAEWGRRLDPMAYRVLRHEATERPYSSPLDRESRSGTYVCAGCELPLFRSAWKFDSGTGWPSFFRVIEANIGTRPDYQLVVPRTEYHCARCLGHQGHVFEDGPRPTGLRYCNNGVALSFIPS